ncbi:MAG: AAA family ATPase [Magnetococcales bacterium]|nr:AAA family ATPase [Magnetococcales bacterium]
MPMNKHDKKPLIQSIQVRNLLSFGPDTPAMNLRSLNVLIGENGAGKSNLIDVIGILQAAPTNLLIPFKGKASGGIAEWLWKGGHGESDSEPVQASIEVQLHHPDTRKEILLRHRLSFSVAGQKLELTDEAVEDARPEQQYHHDVRFYYRFQSGRPVLSVFASDEEEDAGRQRGKRELKKQDVSFDQSILSQRKDPDQYPEITYIAKQYTGIKLYREWHLGRNAPPRQPHPSDMPGDHLNEDASNLVLVLNALEMNPRARERLLDKIKEFNGRFTRIYPKVEMGSIQLYLEEILSADTRHSALIPASRLSDGTMRFLCLLAVLCHPNPPPLVCIEEPEMGLHPDILPTVAQLLLEASERTQLIVTTHSDIIVDALTETPEAVVVCEKQNGQTRMRRLEQKDLQAWITDYRLGQAWLNGKVGATRW